MKSSHQLKSVRRKVIRSARRENIESVPPPNLSLSSPTQTVPVVVEGSTSDKKRSQLNPRMMKAQSYH